MEGETGASRMDDVAKVEESAPPVGGEGGSDKDVVLDKAGVERGGGEEVDAQELAALTKGMSKEALRIAQLLSVSPDVVNISVNVGFNTKVAVDEILSLRSENAELRQENRRLRARLGENPDGSGTNPGQQLLKMKANELINVVQVTEARVRELELENARTRLQMTFMPERVHTSGHGGKPWAA